jgi:hypothetical protein
VMALFESLQGQRSHPEDAHPASHREQYLYASPRDTEEVHETGPPKERIASPEKQDYLPVGNPTIRRRPQNRHYPQEWRERIQCFARASTQG